VLVINKAMRLEERSIEIGLSNWQYSEVIAGLAAAEKVVTSINREGVEAGALVSVKQVSATP
jgi:HlyD family secretion protein